MGNLSDCQPAALYDETLSPGSLQRTALAECDVIAIRAVRITKPGMLTARKRLKV
jgi:hypothetical protein